MRLELDVEGEDRTKVVVVVFGACGRRADGLCRRGFEMPQVSATFGFDIGSKRGDSSLSGDYSSTVGSLIPIVSVKSTEFGKTETRARDDELHRRRLG